jgi:hypothetical protein
MRKTLVHFSMFALLLALMVPAVACQKKAEQGTDQMQEQTTTEQAPTAEQGGEMGQGMESTGQMGEGMESTGQMGEGMENTGQMGEGTMGSDQGDDSGNMQDDNSGS